MKAKGSGDKDREQDSFPEGTTETTHGCSPRFPRVRTKEDDPLTLILHKFEEFHRRLSLFSIWIQRSIGIPPPKPLKIHHYNGHTDPYTHLEYFESAVRGKYHDDAILCHLFQETLSNDAMSWFYESLPVSINSFQELQDAFLKRFQLVADSFEGSSDNLGIDQSPDESLHKFINRWCLAT
ncbi:hypothetical protein ACLB2K_007259 [Fragaria x ananassa]